MYLQEIKGILDGQFVKIKYDCNGSFERCGKEWLLKLKDAKKNFGNNGGKHLCRQCQLKANNPAKRKEVREKMKKTTLERHGVTCALNKPENIAARNEKMFGTQEAIDARTEKTKKTNLKLYGVEHAAQSEEKKEKALETFREKYGTDHPMQNEGVKEQTRKTCQERYGVNNVLSLPEVRIKGAQTTLERYGVEHYNQLPEMKDYLRDNCKDWLEESYKVGGPNAGKPRPEEWNRKQRETVALKILAGEWMSGFPSCHKGRYNSEKCRKKNPPFKSGFELIYHVWLDRNKNVEWYDYEFCKIPYQKQDGSTHLYFPDFLVAFKSGVLQADEVKADFQKDKLDTKAKYNAATEYFGQFNIKFGMLYKDDIYALGITIDEVLLLPEVTLYAKTKSEA